MTNQGELCEIRRRAQSIKDFAAGTVADGGVRQAHTVQNVTSKLCENLRDSGAG
jgi:hypothetical protein